MKSLKIAAAAIVVAGFATAAHAATITETGTVAQSTTDYTLPFTVTGGASSTSFSGFNSALGTLTGVTVSFTVTGTQTGSLTNNAANSQTFTYQTSLNVGLTGSGPAPLLNSSLSFANAGLTLSDTNSAKYTLASGASTSLLPTPNAFNPSTATGTASFSSASDLAAFTNIAAFTLDAETLSGQTVSGGGGNIKATLATTAGETVTIAYTYTPVVTAVPEPSTLAVLGAGLVGLGFIRRRKAA